MSSTCWSRSVAPRSGDRSRHPLSPANKGKPDLATHVAHSATCPQERSCMPRQGEDFQKLVAYLERAVADQPKVTIESPKLIPDKVTGDLREHDIVITQRFPQREITTAIECRDL